MYNDNLDCLRKDLPALEGPRGFSFPSDVMPGDKETLIGVSLRSVLALCLIKRQSRTVMFLSLAFANTRAGEFSPALDTTALPELNKSCSFLIPDSFST